MSHTDNLAVVLRYFVIEVRGLPWVPGFYVEERWNGLDPWPEEEGPPPPMGSYIASWDDHMGPQPTVEEVMAHEDAWLAWKAAQPVPRAVPTVRTDLISKSTRDEYKTAATDADKLRIIAKILDLE